MEEKKQKRRIWWKILLAVVLLALAGVGGWLGYLYHIDHTTLGRKLSIYSIDVSERTADEAMKLVQQAFAVEKVTIREEDGGTLETTIEELGYSLNEESLRAALENIQTERRKTFRPVEKQTEYRIGYKADLDEAKAGTVLVSSGFGEKERKPSTDAVIRYDKKKKQYKVISDTLGTEIDEKALFTYVTGKLDEEIREELLGNREVILDKSIYKKPSKTVTKEMKQKVKKLNKRLKIYRSSPVTYTFGDSTEVIDKAKIESWINIGKEKVSLDQDKIREYVYNLAVNYDTIYGPRSFHTSEGTDITVSGNEYGYQIDQEQEFKQLIKDLTSGKAVTREPVYSIRGFKRNGRDDLAGSYIEVSIDRQHLWLYKDGNLVTQTDIVSGAPTPERQTYRGAWPIPFKASPFDLSSQEYGYKVTVKYWMPFVYGQGLHDASWQKAFGGNRYKTGAGSHGCINLPEDQAALIYNTIDAGYPIIIY